MPYVIVPDQPDETAPLGHEYDHLITPGRTLFDSAEAAYTNAGEAGVIVLRCDPPTATSRSAWERIQVVWVLSDNRTVLSTMRDSSDDKTIVGKIYDVTLTALRRENGDWCIEEVHLTGHYIFNGEVSKMAVYRDYGDGHQCYKLTQLPAWILDLVKAELDGRSAR